MSNLPVDNRPTTVDKLFGAKQKSVAEYLMSNQSDSRAVMLSGPSGVGKTTVALMYAHSIIGTSGEYNIQMLNCGEKTGIDDIRNVILNNMSMMGFGGGNRVFILDEVHLLSAQARNALLNPLESLPPHVWVIATTTEPSKLTKALSSRFVHFDFPVPTRNDQIAMAYQVLVDIGGDAELSKAKVYEIIDMSNGNMRVLVNNVRTVVGGLPLVKDEEEALSVSLVKDLIFNKGGNCIAIAEGVTDYNTEAIMMTGYAIKMLSSNVAAYHKVAIAVVTNFGDGLSPFAPPKNSFYVRLVRTMEEIHGKR